eukprot:TRINITY_DN22856_c0_g1_i3.p1 TRINITY_DN22856_c0_g1~~TRINITY_DN22856_c0_g1_i3.p1  ORF type:complete len:415 (+),score=88.31 TRINITY_DN22856_c0_g1_i3:116-1360(+)
MEPDPLASQHEGQSEPLAAAAVESRSEGQTPRSRAQGLVLHQLRRAMSGSVALAGSPAQVSLASAGASPATALINSVSSSVASRAEEAQGDVAHSLIAARSPEERLQELVSSGQSRRDAMRQVAQENMGAELREGLTDTINSEEGLIGPARACGSCCGLVLVLFFLSMLIACIGVCIVSVCLHLMGWFLTWKFLGCHSKYDLRVWLVTYQTVSMLEASLTSLLKGRARHIAEVLDSRVGPGFARSCSVLYSLTMFCAKVYWCVHTQTLVAHFMKEGLHKGDCGGILVSFMNWYSSILLLQLVMVEPFIRLGLGVVVWLANSGLLSTARGAKPGTLENLEVIDFDADLFADAMDSSDSRPQKECCICLDEYSAECAIIKTPCQHLMHRECLAKWLKTSHFCPICRGNLEEEECPA